MSSISTNANNANNGTILLRLALIGVAIVRLGPLVIQAFNILPHGWPSLQWDGRNEYASFDSTNTRLRDGNRSKRIYGRDDRQGNTARLLQGTETVILRPNPNATNGELDDSTLYLLSTEHGCLLSLTDIRPDDIDKSGERLTAQVNFIKDLGNGSPLSGVFTKDGQTLYIADAVLGLTRISNVVDNPEHAKVEIVASSITTTETSSMEEENHHHHHQHNTKLRYVDDVALGPRTGIIYFTDASEVRPEIIGNGPPDLYYSSKVDFIRGGNGTGRILSYDPTTDHVQVLVDGIRFANGLAVGDVEETFLIYTEAFGPRIWKYNLITQTSTILVDRSDMIGYPDGGDCMYNTNDGSSTCFVTFPSCIALPHKILSSLPSWLDRMLRFVLLLLPRQLAPNLDPFGGIMQINPQEGTFEYMLDPKGEKLSFLNGVTIHKPTNKIYLGSLHNPYIGVLSLDE